MPSNKNVPKARAIKVVVTAIRADDRAQPRAVSADLVAQYAEDMQRGDKFPPLTVFRDKEGVWLSDGFHRYYAALSRQLKTIECEVSKGGLRDAILFACAANAGHGLRRTNEEKRQAVNKLLADEVWGKWSDREIARRCHVNHHLVASEREQLAGTGRTPGMEERTFTHHKTGKPTTMKVGNIGGNDVDPTASAAQRMDEPASELTPVTPGAPPLANLPEEQRRALAERAKAGEKVSAKVEPKVTPNHAGNDVDPECSAELRKAEAVEQAEVNSPCAGESISANDPPLDTSSAEESSVVDTPRAIGKSRPARWAAAVQAALDALDDLENLRQEYEEWRENLPENLQSGSVAESLDAVINLDVQGAISAVQEFEGVDLPRGFGRD
jgi:hypothetical protein